MPCAYPVTMAYVAIPTAHRCVAATGVPADVHRAVRSAQSDVIDVSRRRGRRVRSRGFGATGELLSNEGIVSPFEHVRDRRER